MPGGGILEEDQIEERELREEDRFLLIFAYLGALAIVSLALARRDFVRWHARQGLMLTVSAIVTFLILRIPHAICYRIWTFLGSVFLTLELLILLGFLIVSMTCMAHARVPRCA